MLHVHLHLHERGAIIRDLEGRECDDLAGARAAAIRAIRDVIAADVRSGVLDLTGSIAICDADDALLAIVSFRDAITVVADA